MILRYLANSYNTLLSTDNYLAHAKTNLSANFVFKKVVEMYNSLHNELKNIEFLLQKLKEKTLKTKFTEQVAMSYIYIYIYRCLFDFIEVSLN